MWNYASMPGQNSVTNNYRKMWKKEKLVMLVTRNIKKIGHTQWIDNPIEDFFREYNEHTWQEFTKVEELDEVTLEWLHNMFAISIHELCEKIKADSQKVLEPQS